MRLVYIGTENPVRIGDILPFEREGQEPTFIKVTHFTQPHKPASIGKVQVQFCNKQGLPSGGKLSTMEYYVSVIGAEWIEREDRQDA